MKTKHKAYVYVMIFVLFLLTIVTYMNRDIPIDDLPEQPNTNVALPFVSKELSELNAGWNIVSMEDTYNTEDVYVIYDNVTYTWEEAISNTIIFHKLYGYNKSGYYLSDTFTKHKGYWLYAFEEPVMLSSEPNVIYCSKLYFDGIEEYTCTKIVVSPTYSNEIHCSKITVDSMMFIYNDVGEVTSD